MEHLHGGTFRLIADQEKMPDGRRAILVREPGAARRQSARFLASPDRGAGMYEIDPDDTANFDRILNRTALRVMEDGTSRVRIDAYDPIWGDYPDAANLILEQSQQAELQAIGEELTKPCDFEDPCPGDSSTPAAYTYIGQFIAHDLSNMQVMSAGTINLQTTSLDLSSIFGHAADLTQTFVGPTTPGNDLRDIARQPGGAPNIKDARNDANLGVAQVHNMIARFFLRERARPGQSDAGAHRSTIDYFQWVVLHDYLPRLVGQTMVDMVLAGPRLLSPSAEFLVPMEFALACFRFGHAQVRNNYFGGFGPHLASSRTLIEFTHAGGVIAGAEDKLPADWPMIWSSMVGPNTTVFARRIAARIAHEHGAITTDIVSDPQAPSGSTINLATETLMRGERLHLPKAQVLIDWIKTNRADIGPLGTVDLSDPVWFAKAVRYTTPQLRQRLENSLITQTPLWLYTLLESQAVEDGERLGPLASRIVAETLIASIEADPLGIRSPGSLFQPKDVNGQVFPGKFEFSHFVERAFSP